MDSLQFTLIKTSIGKVSYVRLGFILAVLVCFSITPVRAQIESAVQAFDEGNEQYRTGNYQEAIAAYQQAINSGYTSGALYYNMGNANFRLDELGQAVLYYEKARLLMPENPELLHNLDIAKSKAVDQFSQLPVPVWVTWWRTMLERTGGRWLFWVGLLFYLLAVGVVVYRIRTGSRNPWLRRARAASILLGAGFLLSAFAASMQSVETRQAVILVERTDLRESPDASSASELQIHEGLVIDVLQKNNGWVEIKLPNGTTGWVPVESTGEI